MDPFAGACEMLRSLDAGTVSSLELVDLHLERIGRFDADLAAFVTVDEDGARAAARRADGARAAGDPIGPLHGLPISLKDCFATAGLRTTAGMVELEDHVPETDAVAVQRLRGAGAIVLGKTNLPAGVSGQETANRIAGRTCNPWDRGRTSGGSSGGAATALAAGLSPLDLGSDSGGSIRQPAHCCGVFGHVATHGLVPQRGHLPSVPVDDAGAVLDLFSIGPMARHPDDLALALSVLVGPDPVGPEAWEVHLPPPAVPDHGVSGVRLTVVSTDPACPVGHPVRECIDGVASALEDAGAHLVDVWPPFDVAHAMDVAFRLWVAASAEDDDGAGGGDDQLSVARREARRMTHADWLELDTERRRLSRAWVEVFDSIDVLLCPVSPVPAVEHDPEETSVDEVGHRLERRIEVDGELRPYLDQIRWNVLTGMAGLPVTAAPVGRTAAGLPVAVQVASAPHRDRTTLAFARTMTEVVGGFTPPPGFR
jgi:amidase